MIPERSTSEISPPDHSLGFLDALRDTLIHYPQCTESATDHHFAGGMYCRRMHIPKGVLILGKIHKSEHFLIGCQGELKVWGHGAPKRLRGGDVLVSPPGTRRVLYALSDAIFLNIHRAEPQPIEALEAELMEPDPECPFDAFNHLKPGFLEVRPCG